MAGEIQLTGPDLAADGISLEDLNPDIPVAGHFEGQPVAVVATTDGVRAISGKCSHYGGPLAEGLCVGNEIRCPWHHAAFDLETGEAVGAPALNPIPVFQTDEKDGRVFVTGPKPRSDHRPTPPSKPDSVVIVGSGAAGAAAAEALRRYGYEGPISLIGGEAPIDRPNLSKDYLAGTAPEEWMPLRSPQFYADAGIELISGRQVEAIEPAGRVVRLAGGDEVRYGALLLAPGAEPRRLPVPGADAPHVHYLRTLEDSRAIIAALENSTQAAVVGAGFIGLEVAASLRHRNIDVTVIAPEKTPLADVVGEALGRFVADLHREHGVIFQLERSVTEITPEEVVLDDGTKLPADLVVVGIGVNPRIELAEAAGLATDRGITVDRYLRTSDPHIWAAGDVARYPGFDGEAVRVEHWVLAERQGQNAARNILGYEDPFTEPPFFWSQHYDVPINVTGHLAGWDEEVVNGDAGQRDVLVGFRKDGVVRAVASIYRDRENLRAEAALATDDQARLAELLEPAQP
jgi:NADPH-dependent 2,4-dienoyl-CoA reductase/sulfur reductase-like enzyme/nitrite reductase/ring-hydroxylating ferredoxin subunit